MAEGTRIRTLDERLGVHEGKLTELHEGLTQNREEVNQRLGEINNQMDGFGVRMDKMDNNFEELKQLILGLQVSGNDTANRSVHRNDVRRDNPDLRSSNRSEVNNPSFTVGLSSTASIQTPVTPLHTTHPLPPPNSTPHIYHQSNGPPPLYHAPMSTSNTPPYIPCFPPSTTTQMVTNQPPFSTAVGSNNLHNIIIPPFNGYTYQHQLPSYTYPGFTPPSPHHRFNHNPHMFNPHPKLEFPKFEGNDPKGWILKAEQYFDFVHIEEEKKIKLAGLHFEGKASVWFRYYQSSRPHLNWKMFQNDLIIRFEDPDSRDAQDSFNKLRQVGTISVYEDSFEELRALVVARNKGLTEDYFISSFISDLKDHIKTSDRMFRPQLLVDAVFLAKQEAAKQKGQSSGINKPSTIKPHSTTNNEP